MSADSRTAPAADDRRDRSVIVAGGGLIGLTTAFFLARRGARVLVLERGLLGSGASRGNAGEITSMADPLPGPGLVLGAARGLFRPGSALFVHPRPSLELGRFLTRLARHSTRRAYEAGLQAMAQLSHMTFRLYDELARDGIGGGMATDGYLVCCASEASALAQRRQFERMAELGIASRPGPLLRGRELAEAEPSLSGAAGVGFLQPGERWIDPSRLVDSLADALTGMGVELIQGARVTRVRERRDAVEVESTSGRHGGDAAVIASGIWSEDLCRGMGIALGMQPGKGYSFTVRPEPMPRRLVHLADAHVVATPMGDSLRIAGTMEFDGSTDRFDPRRVEAIVAAARGYLAGIDWSARTNEWVGPRPMTPDGLPFIGPVPGRRRVYVATGHNMLGLTLAPSTAEVVADLVLEGHTDVDIAPFSVGRF